jgi:hypothetical protein
MDKHSQSMNLLKFVERYSREESCKEQLQSVNNEQDGIFQ